MTPSERLEYVGNLIDSMESKELFVNQVDITPRREFEAMNTKQHFAAIFQEVIDAQENIPLDRDQFESFVIQVRAWEYCLDLERLKNLISELIIPERLHYPKEIEKDFTPNLRNTSLGDLLDRTSYQIYDENLEENKKTMKRFFHQDFRNAIFHDDYNIVLGEIVWNNPEEQVSNKGYRQMDDDLTFLETMFQDKYNSLLPNI